MSASQGWNVMVSSLAHLSIPLKLGLQALCITLVATIIAATAIQGVDRLSTLADDLASRGARRASLAMEAESLFNSAAINEKNAIFYREESMRQAQINDYDETVAKVSTLLDELVPLIETQEAREHVATFRRAVEERRRASHRVFELAQAGRIDEAFDYSVGVAAKSRQVAIKAVGALVVESRASLETARRDAKDIASLTRRWLIIGSGAGFGIVLLMSYWLTTTLIVRPLTEITAAAGRLAVGDLEVVIKGTARQDEIGALARSVEGLRARARS
jgi:HAMP domain-containing protein